ncbi:MAG: NifB/NifX family molybdenum-iron cluster-binding protein [Phycisphaerae bacterium]|nr:NifB/NifX family molybdenum-iron cluster-binding protein [Phycisphaerae bacterium]
MKIAFCAINDNPDSLIDARFGRTGYIAIYDEETKNWQFIANQQDLQAAQGAGLKTAQYLLDARADILIAKNVGPKAMRALQGDGIEVYQVVEEISANQALKKYLDGQLLKMEQANVQGHW